MTIKNEEIQRVQLTDCNFTVQNMHNVSLCIFIHISNKLGCGIFVVVVVLELLLPWYYLNKKVVIVVVSLLLLFFTT